MYGNQGIFMDAIKRIFRRPTPSEMAAKELAEAELSLLEARTAHEYAASIITYRDTQCKRLRKFLASGDNT
jgi:hypothetical protein